MVEVSYERLATIFKALSDETRLHIIDMLSCNELCAADILASFNLDILPQLYKTKDECICAQIKYCRISEHEKEA